MRGGLTVYTGRGVSEWWFNSIHREGSEWWFNSIHREGSE